MKQLHRPSIRRAAASLVRLVPRVGIDSDSVCRGSPPTDRGGPRASLRLGGRRPTQGSDGSPTSSVYPAQAPIYRLCSSRNNNSGTQKPASTHCPVSSPTVIWTRIPTPLVSLPSRVLTPLQSLASIRLLINAYQPFRSVRLSAVSLRLFYFPSPTVCEATATNLHRLFIHFLPYLLFSVSLCPLLPPSSSSSTASIRPFSEQSPSSMVCTLHHPPLFYVYPSTPL